MIGLVANDAWLWFSVGLVVDGVGVRDRRYGFCDWWCVVLGLEFGLAVGGAVRWWVWCWLGRRCCAFVGLMAGDAQWWLVMRNGGLVVHGVGVRDGQWVLE